MTIELVGDVIIILHKNEALFMDSHKNTIKLPVSPHCQMLKEFVAKHRRLPNPADAANFHCTLWINCTPSPHPISVSFKNGKPKIKGLCPPIWDTITALAAEERKPCRKLADAILSPNPPITSLPPQLTIPLAALSSHKPKPTPTPPQAKQKTKPTHTQRTTSRTKPNPPTPTPTPNK